MEILLYFGNEIYRYAVEIASLSDRSEENHIIFMLRLSEDSH